MALLFIPRAANILMAICTTSSRRHVWLEATVASYKVQSIA